MQAMAAVPDTKPQPVLVFDRPAQVRALIIALAFAAVYHVVLRTLARQWQSADWSHGWLIPLFSIYLVYMRWERVRRCPVRHAWVGLVLMLAALGMYQYSLWGVVIGYLRPLSMLLCLLGVIIYLFGLPMLRHVWVPWLYLFFAIPLPKRIYFALTDPLRRIAATAATALLNLIPDLDIERVGSTISYMYGGQHGGLDVADACSGMRSAMTLCALGVAVAFVSDRPWWQRAILIAMCIPIAILANIIRVTITCLLYVFVDPKYATGTYHAILGLVTLMIAFGIFTGVGWLLSNLFVDESAAGSEAS